MYVSARTKPLPAAAPTSLSMDLLSPGGTRFLFLEGVKVRFKGGWQENMQNLIRIHPEVCGFFGVLRTIGQLSVQDR